jgi:hypothetical protein
MRRVCGLRILDAILAGQRDASQLAKLRDHRGQQERPRTDGSHLSRRLSARASLCLGPKSAGSTAPTRLGPKSATLRLRGSCNNWPSVSNHPVHSEPSEWEFWPTPHTRRSAQGGCEAKKKRFLRPAEPKHKEPTQHSGHPGAFRPGNHAQLRTGRSGRGPTGWSSDRVRTGSRCSRWGRTPWASGAAALRTVAQEPGDFFAL